MKIFKLLFRILFVLLIALVLAAIVIPMVFKDDIVAAIKTEINKKVNAKVDFADVDFSILSTFPNAGITIEQLNVSGLDQFQGTPLATIDASTVEISLPSFLSKSKPWEIRRLIFDHPTINAVVLPDGTANYDITKPTEEESKASPFTIKMKSYEVRNGNVRYDNKMSQQFATINGINHKGAGNFSNDRFDLDTKTTIEKINFKNKGISYMSDGSAEADAKIDVDMAAQKYTLKDNTLRVNALDLTVDGFVQMIGEAMNIDLNIAAPNEDAKGLLSVVPGVYNEQYKDARVNGQASTKIKIKGKYDGEKDILPAIDIAANIKDGAVKYPALPKELSNINAAIFVNAKEGDYTDMVVNIPSFSTQLGVNTIAGALTTKNISTDPTVDGKLKGVIVLEDWKDALPLESIEKLQGSISSDIEFAGKKSDVDRQNYNAITFKGDVYGNDIVYKDKLRPEVNIREVKSTISPSKVVLNSQQMQLGKSTLDGALTIYNPLAYMTKSGKSNTKLQANAKLFDMNEWMPEPTEKADTTTTKIPESIANVELDLKANRVLYTTYDLRDIVVTGKHQNNAMTISNFSGKMKDSDFSLRGNIDNTLGYFNDQQTLTGDLTFSSDKIVLQDFYDENAEETESTEHIPVPENIDININAAIKDVIYNKMNLKNMTGNIAVKEQRAELRDGESQGLGGIIKFAGLYGTPTGEKPDFSFKYDLSNLDFEKTFASVEMTKSIAPLMKYVKGVFNSTMTIDGKLGENMMPDIGSINAAGFLETISGTLKNMDFSNKVADKLGIEEVRQLAIEHTKNWFEIKDGTMQVKPFSQKIKNIDMAISGSHKLDGPMDYTVVMNVPRAMLKGNTITNAANEGLKFLEKEAGKYGVNIDQGDFIKLKVGLTGMLTDPNVKITPLGSGGKASMEDIVKAEVNNSVQKAKYSVTTAFNKQKEVLRDTLDKTVKKAKDSIRTVVDNTVETVKDTVAKTIEKEVGKQVGNIIGDSTSVGKEVKDILNNSTDKTVDDIKDEISKWNPFKKKKKD